MDDSDYAIYVVYSEVVLAYSFLSHVSVRANVSAMGTSIFTHTRATVRLNYLFVVAPRGARDVPHITIDAAARSKKLNGAVTRKKFA